MLANIMPNAVQLEKKLSDERTKRTKFEQDLDKAKVTSFVCRRSTVLGTSHADK